MKTRLFICTLLILAMSFISTFPVWAEQTTAYASILIIIPGPDEAEEEIKEELPEPKEQQEQHMLAKGNSDFAEEEE